MYLLGESISAESIIDLHYHYTLGIHYNCQRFLNNSNYSLEIRINGWNSVTSLAHARTRKKSLPQTRPL